MKAGSFAKWTGTAEDGKTFCYVGKVVKTKADSITLETVDGIMGFKLGDGEVVKASKPKRFDELVAARNERLNKVERLTKVLPRDRKTVRKTKRKASASGKTKQEMVNDLVKEHIEKFGGMPSRKDAIAHIVELGITTAAGASTMFATAKRKLG